ncbi:MAG: CDP-glycerol glycerophosphotransferase family protein [Desulfovibrio sp.]|nr:CDP-glycerol glycerophosphotransferase family protein [Desulfovibrio sp.]
MQKDSSRHYGNIPCVHAALGQSVHSMIISDREQKPRNAMRLARARVLVQDQCSQMVSNMRKSSGTVVVQLWHSGGWYKKVGYDAPRPGYDLESERQRILHIHGQTDYMVISDAKLVSSYAKAFRLPEQHVLPLGLPRTDSLLARKKEEDRAFLESLYPQLTNKKIFLYAPTWRSDRATGVRRQPDGPDVAVLRQELDEKWAFCWRSHPTVRSGSVPSGWIDVSNLAQDFCLSVTDVLVTDYSSILFDFALLERPCYLFTPDRDNYVARERGLYLEPEEIAPGAVAVITEELAHVVARGVNVSSSLRLRFMSACDGGSTARVVNFLQGVAQ